MNLYFRLLLTWLATRFESAISARDGCEQWFRVWPLDLDLFGHMNNGRYLQIMDVARFRWMLRAGVVRALHQNRWRVVLGGTVTRHRASLRLFARYKVRTRLVSTDARWFIFEHALFDARDRLVASNLCRAAVLDDSGWLTTEQVLQEVDPDALFPWPSEHIASWLEADAGLDSKLREERRSSERSHALEAAVPPAAVGQS